MVENTELMTVDNICNRVYVIRGQRLCWITIWLRFMGMK